MSSDEYIVVALLVILVAFGLGNFISAPIIARRFYRDYGFLEAGKSLLNDPAESVLMEPLSTSQLYRGSYKSCTIEHCKAYPKTRREFTLSKVKRKHNQTRWSITRLISTDNLPSFCLLPTSEPATVFLMLGDRGVDLDEDPEFQQRYFLRSDYPDSVKPLFSGEIREFLMQKELISVECVGNSVMIKRLWPDAKIQSRLLDELDCAVEITAQLSNTH